MSQPAGLPQGKYKVIQSEMSHLLHAQKLPEPNSWLVMPSPKNLGSPRNSQGWLGFFFSFFLGTRQLEILS